MERIKFLRWIIIAAFFLVFKTAGYAQPLTLKKMVEVSGIVLSEDSVYRVANAVISVLHENRGVLTNESGVYSLVCHPGDTLIFNSVGFRIGRFILPEIIKGDFYNHVQLLKQDTFYLKETVIHGLPSGKEFVYAFKYWSIEESLNDRALSRFSGDQVNMLRAIIPRSGAENQAIYQQRQAVNASYEGLQRSGIGILSPLKWAEFINAWKRGDLRRQKY